MADAARERVRCDDDPIMSGAVIPTLEILPGERAARWSGGIGRAASGRRSFAKANIDAAQRGLQNGMGAKPPLHSAAWLVGRFVLLRPQRAPDLIRIDPGTSGETEYAPPLFR